MPGDKTALFVPKKRAAWAFGVCLQASGPGGSKGCPPNTGQRRNHVCPVPRQPDSRVPRWDIFVRDCARGAQRPGRLRAGKGPPQRAHRRRRGADRAQGAGAGFRGEVPGGTDDPPGARLSWPEPGADLDRRAGQGSGPRVPEREGGRRPPTGPGQQMSPGLPAATAGDRAHTSSHSRLYERPPRASLSVCTSAGTASPKPLRLGPLRRVKVGRTRRGRSPSPSGFGGSAVAAPAQTLREALNLIATWYQSPSGPRLARTASRSMPSSSNLRYRVERDIPRARAARLIFLYLRRAIRMRRRSCSRTLSSEDTA